MTARNVLALVLAGCAAGAAAGCTYDPPPEVSLVAPEGNRFLVGDPIRLAFSEPVRPESLEVRVWPGQKDLYDREGERLADVAPLLDLCTVATSPCGGGVVLAVTDDRTGASIDVPDGGLGPTSQPLVLEVTGSIEDDAGRRKKVSRSFDFQIVREAWNPYADAWEEDAPDAVEPGLIDRTVAEGPHFFFASFTTPITISQQFWCDARIDEEHGRYMMIMTDADPADGAPQNTKDPGQCVLDKGEEGFLFVAQGRIYQESPGADPVFVGDPFTLGQTIGPIFFELRDVVIRGTVTVEDGRSRWDGTMAISGLYYQVGEIEHLYPPDQANFQVFQLLDSEGVADMPCLCDEDPCEGFEGDCDLPDGPWPPEGFCPAEQAGT